MRPDTVIASSCSQFLVCLPSVHSYVSAPRTCHILHNILDQYRRTTPTAKMFIGRGRVVQVEAGQHLQWGKATRLSSLAEPNIMIIRSI